MQEEKRLIPKQCPVGTSVSAGRVREGDGPFWCGGRRGGRALGGSGGGKTVTIDLTFIHYGAYLVYGALRPASPPAFTPPVLMIGECRPCSHHWADGVGRPPRESPTGVTAIGC